MPTRIALLFLTGLLASCAAPPPAAINGQQDPLQALAALPERILGADRIGEAQQDTASFVTQGAWARYRAPGALMTVHLYRTAAAPVPDGPESFEVRDQLLQATRDIPLVAQMRAAQDNAAADFGPVSGFDYRPPQGPGFICTETPRLGGPQPQGEFVCATGQQAHVLKIRTTLRHQPGQEQIARRFVAAFAREVSLGLAAAAPAPAQPAATPLGGAPKD